MRYMSEDDRASPSIIYTVMDGNINKVKGKETDIEQKNYGGIAKAQKETRAVTREKRNNTVILLFHRWFEFEYFEGTEGGNFYGSVGIWLD